MNERQALEAAQQIGVAQGDHIFLQNEGQINHPHFHKHQTAGQMHVDAWKVENVGGSLQAQKGHSN